MFAQMFCSKQGKLVRRRWSIAGGSYLYEPFVLAKQAGKIELRVDQVQEWCPNRSLANCLPYQVAEARLSYLNGFVRTQLIETRFVLTARPNLTQCNEARDRGQVERIESATTTATGGATRTGRRAA